MSSTVAGLNGDLGPDSHRLPVNADPKPVDYFHAVIYHAPSKNDTLCNPVRLPDKDFNPPVRVPSVTDLANGATGSSHQRRYVLAGLVVVLGVVTGGILLEVLGTILLALTVAYVLVPVQRWFVRRGLTEWTGALAATLVGFGVTLAVSTPLVVALYFRLEDVVDTLAALPRELSVSAVGMTYAIETGQIQAAALEFVQGAATSFALALPVLAIKFALFVVLLFGLLLKGDAAGRAAIAPVPYEYRDVVYALARRTRETLYAIYVLQVATSIATFAAAYPLFWVLGYEAALTLAIAAAVLQFVPIIARVCSSSRSRSTTSLSATSSQRHCLAHSDSS